MQYFDAIKNFETVDGIIDKLTTKVIEYEWILMELKKNLNERNIRRVYRQLYVPMPPDLEAHLKKTGCILWEEFTKSAINKFDIKSVMSQKLGQFDTGLCVLPPVDSLYVTMEVDGAIGGIFKN